jgi:hypothetical protein
MAESLECVGYHGTAKEYADKIGREGYIDSSEISWLGRGVYFFGSIEAHLDGFEEARAWAVFVRKFNSWVVFEAVIKSEDFLDLVNDVEHRELFEAIRNELISIHIQSGRRIGEFADYIIYKRIDEKYSPDFVRAYVEAGNRFMGYQPRTIRRLQIQICVKDCRCIIKNTIRAKGTR